MKCDFLMVFLVFVVNVYSQESWLFPAITENFATNDTYKSTQVISKFHKT